MTARMPAVAAWAVPRRSHRLHVLGQMVASPSAMASYEEQIAVWRRDDLQRLVPDAAGTRSYATESRSLVERMMRCDIRTYLTDDILQKVDRATMATSLEARVPFLDPGVVGAAMASTAIAVRHPGEKSLLRQALRLRLPGALVDRPKMGFRVPVGAWMRNELRPLVEDHVLARRDADYDLDTARAVCEAHLSGRRDASAQVWSLLMYELWRERWCS
jgi:asparagine synthase (glutamine-hydrolysing)